MSPPETQMAWKLPADLLHEIIARSDHRTLVRCAATCKLFRRDILTPPFDPRAAPCILAYLMPDAKKPLALLHPTTPAASSFCRSRFRSRKATKFLCKYGLVASRRGLVVLRRRRNFQDPPESSNGCFDTCVYDPMGGAQSFVSNPPEAPSGCDRRYVLLTAADGIDTNSFLLLAFDFHGSNMTVHTASSCGTWQSVTFAYESSGHQDYFPSWMTKRCGDPAILSGGVIHHWLQKSAKDQILSYDLRTGKMGTVELPSTDYKYGSQIYLATSTDRKLLKLLAIQGFKMFVWVQLRVSKAGGTGWSLETVIDMEDNMRSLYPGITNYPCEDEYIEFEGSGKSTGDVVFLWVRARGYSNDFYIYDNVLVFDLETKKIFRQKQGLALLEIDLPSLLQTMKIFS